MQPLAVKRLVCKATTYDVDMIVDIASEVYSLGKDDKFTLALVSTLRLDGRKDDDSYDQSGRETLLDQYDYGMCGRVFQFDIKESHV
jgi:DNA-directed RNA polymerase I, II, and III subunit RPABC3